MNATDSTIMEFMRQSRIFKSFVTLVAIGSLLLNLHAQTAHISVSEDAVDITYPVIAGHDYRLFGSPTLVGWADYSETKTANENSLAFHLERDKARFFVLVDLTLTKGWVAMKTNNQTTDVIAAHESGDWIGVNTSRDVDGLLDTVETVSYFPTGGGAVHFEVDERGRPTRAFGEGEMILFHRWDDNAGTVSMSLIDSTGAVSFHEVSYPNSEIPIPFSTGPSQGRAIESESGIDRAKLLRGLGWMISMAGCAVSISATIGSGGLAGVFAVYACSSFALNTARLLLPEDNPALTSVSVFLDAASCALDPGFVSRAFACASTVGGMAESLDGERLAFLNIYGAAVVNEEIARGLPYLAAGTWSVTSTSGAGEPGFVAFADLKFREIGKTILRAWEYNGSAVVFHIPNFDLVGHMVSKDEMRGAVYYLGFIEQGTWRASRQ